MNRNPNDRSPTIKRQSVVSVRVTPGGTQSVPLAPSLERANLGETFSKAQRLCHKLEFEAVFNHRQSAAGQCLIVYGQRNGLPFNRLGMTVTRRLGTAVVRNRFKRLCREVFRRSRLEQPVGWDWIILPQKSTYARTKPKKKKSGKTERTGKEKAKSNQPPTFRWTYQAVWEDLLPLMQRIARRPAR